MKIKIILLLIVFLFNIKTTLFAFGDSSENTNNEKEIHVGIYTGYVCFPNINDAHGKHGTFFGQSIDANVEGIDINQSWAIGLGAYYYITKNFGFNSDFLYSKALFPEQQVILQGFTINQPKSDLNLYTISIGPNVRYVGEGVWELINPFASLALTILLGNASDVNISPVYGEGGSSSLSGFGFNVHLGTQYHLDNFLLSIEYRFEYLSSEVDHFRSFTQGLSFIKTGSYILLGGNYSF